MPRVTPLSWYSAGTEQPPKFRREDSPCGVAFHQRLACRLQHLLLPPGPSCAASTSISRQRKGSAPGWSSRVAVTRLSATSASGELALPGQSNHGPFGIQDGDGAQGPALPTRRLYLRSQPRRNAARSTIAQRCVPFLPGVLAHRQLEVPALVGPAHPPAQRDLVPDQVEFLGVVIGRAQVVALPPGDLGASLQAAEVGQDKVGVGVLISARFPGGRPCCPSHVQGYVW